MCKDTLVFILLTASLKFFIPDAQLVCVCLHFTQWEKTFRLVIVYLSVMTPFKCWKHFHPPDLWTSFAFVALIVLIEHESNEITFKNMSFMGPNPNPSSLVVQIQNTSSTFLQFPQCLDTPCPPRGQKLFHIFLIGFEWVCLMNSTVTCFSFITVCIKNPSILHLSFYFFPFSSAFTFLQWELTPLFESH